MILPEAKMHSKKYEKIWILPIVSENPMENYIVIYGKENNYILSYKELDFFKFEQSPASPNNPKFSEIMNELRKKYDIEIYQDWEDFNANYILYDLYQGEGHVKVNPYTKNIKYEASKDLVFIDRCVLEKETKNIVYRIWSRGVCSPEEEKSYLEEIEQEFNIIDSKILWNIRNQIKAKIFGE